MANPAPDEAGCGAGGLALGPNHDNSEQGATSVVLAQIPETTGEFTRLSPGEVNLMLYLLCHGIGTEAIGRALAQHRSGGSKRATTQAHIAVMAEEIDYTDAPARTMTALRQTAVEIAQEATNSGHQWYLEHATAWDSDTKGVTADDGDAAAASTRRKALAKFKYQKGRDPKSTKKEIQYLETQRAELQAKEDAAAKYGYTEGDQQGLEAFLLNQLVNMMPIILMDDIDENV